MESAWPGSPFNNGTKVLSGTSMAAPLIAGQALLIVAAIPNISTASTREIIEQSASRGTILGSHIDPDAKGSRVPRIPWLEASSDLTYKIVHGHSPNISGWKLLNNNTIVTVLQTIPSTAPAMQYEVNFVANGVYNALKDRLEQLGMSDLHIECRANSTAQEGAFSVIYQGQNEKMQATASNSGLTREEDALGLRMNIICRMTCNAGKGSALKQAILDSVANGRVRSVFGDAVEARSDPILTNASFWPVDGAIFSRKWPVAVCLCASVVLMFTSVIFWCRCRRKRGCKNQLE